MLIINKNPGRYYIHKIPNNIQKKGGQVVFRWTNTETKATGEFTFWDYYPNNGHYYGLEIYASGLGLNPGLYEYTVGPRNSLDVNRGLMMIAEREVNNTSYYDTETYKYYKD